MTIQYDESIIQKHATDLYERASAIVFWWTTLALAAAAAGAYYYTRP